MDGLLFILSFLFLFCQFFIQNDTDEPRTEGKVGGLSIPSTAVFIVGEIAGTGILALPQAIEHTGIYISLIKTQIISY